MGVGFPGNARTDRKSDAQSPPPSTSGCGNSVLAHVSPFVSARALTSLSLSWVLKQPLLRRTLTLIKLAKKSPPQANKKTAEFGVGLKSDLFQTQGHRQHHKQKKGHPDGAALWIDARNRKRLIRRHPIGAHRKQRHESALRKGECSRPASHRNGHC
jgi:hypothetical protein